MLLAELLQFRPMLFRGDGVSLGARLQVGDLRQQLVARRFGLRDLTFDQRELGRSPLEFRHQPLPLVVRIVGQLSAFGNRFREQTLMFRRGLCDRCGDDAAVFSVQIGEGALLRGFGVLEKALPFGLSFAERLDDPLASDGQPAPRLLRLPGTP